MTATHIEYHVHDQPMSDAASRSVAIMALLVDVYQHWLEPA